jgi:hypothetical protein
MLPSINNVGSSWRGKRFDAGGGGGGATGIEVVEGGPRES